MSISLTLLSIYNVIGFVILDDNGILKRTISQIALENFTGLKGYQKYYAGIAEFPDIFNINSSECKGLENTGLMSNLFWYYVA